MNIDDPKFTAHLLGEFEDLTPEERAEIAALIASDPAAAAEAEETRALAARLRAELPGEAAAALADEQRAAVLQALEPAAPVRSKLLRFPSRAIILTAAAACVVVAASMAVFFPAMQAEKDAARKSILTMTGAPASPTFTAGNERELVAGTAVNAPLPPPPERAQPQFAAGETTGLPIPQIQTAAPALGSKKSESFALDDSKQLAETGPLVADVQVGAFALQPMGGSTIKDQPVSGEKVELKALGDLSAVTSTSVAGEVAKGDAAKHWTRGGAARSDRIAAAAGSFSVGTEVRPDERPSVASLPQPSTSEFTDGLAGTINASSNLGQLSTDAPVNHPAMKTPPIVLMPATPVAPAAATVGIADLTKAKTPSGITATDTAWARPVRTDKAANLKDVDSRIAGNTRARALNFDTGVGQAPEPPAETTVQLSLRDGATDAERYDAIVDNAFLPVREQPLSTFSIDVDTASYANVRRFLSAQQLPPPNAVRIEELLNYFTYDYPQPEGDAPFSATMEVASCPWMPEHRLVRIGLKGKEMSREDRPPSNLVFLIDVSGSMRPENKLPLLKRSLGLLVDQLGPDDTVSIAVYAGASGVVLEPTHSKAEIRTALDRLEAGGSTNGASGIKLAYRLAESSFLKKGTNRVILATDGDFNVGVTNQTELVELIEKKAKSGVFLTVLGFGMGNLKDSTLEKLADKGNGNYAYIDSLLEGKKVLVEQMNGTLFTIAKDVKIQVEFNPTQVASYRLIGYENRMLKKEDFNDDTKDAGEIGSGHTVTALYEVVPPGVVESKLAKVDELKYQSLEKAKEMTEEKSKREDADKSAIRDSQSAMSREMLTLKLRYKAPDGDTSKLLEFPLTDSGAGLEKSSVDFRFAAAVASYGLLLRNSEYKGEANWNATHELATEGKGPDLTGYRTEFISLVEKARVLAR